MKATVENLKASRLEVISELTEMFGSDKLASRMQSLLWIVEEAEKFRPYETIEDCLNLLSELNQTSRLKVSKSAELAAEAAFNRGEEWSQKQGKFIKF